MLINVRSRGRGLYQVEVPRIKIKLEVPSPLTILLSFSSITPPYGNKLCIPSFQGQQLSIGMGYIRLANARGNHIKTLRSIFGCQLKVGLYGQTQCVSSIDGNCFQLSEKPVVQQDGYIV